MKPPAIVAAAKKYERPMVSFLRDLIAIKGTSGQERSVIERVRAEGEKLNTADKIWIYGLGNWLVQIGTGSRLIAMDAHIDTVDVGNPKEWKHDPFTGKEAH